MNSKKNNTKLYIQISAGKGPAECCWVVAQVLKILIKEIEQKGLKYKVISRNKGSENGTLSSVLLSVKGTDTEKKLSEWKGTIQWIGKSPYRKFHKRKNWFIGVSFFQKDKQIMLHERDLTFQTFRASGAGGQHRNKVETAVRATHVPSGITATATDSKSQHQNKKNAIEKIRQAFKVFEVEEMQKSIDAQWVAHLSLERGNAIKVFTGKEFRRI